ncbi:hypothetical protein [uncultured Paraglaciecola sp.]|uniref:hypothetical protein n=1 Tax=uncultured Paraglaciecola sp. TaxID=1765024 RepID=UPI0025EA4554|nr:hypothetical protein [uncultured Paraglaciecola sp.]
MSEPHKSFFQTFTGVLTAITSLIIAVTGLFAATGGFNFNNQPKLSEKPEISQSELTQQKQIRALKLQKEIDDLRIAQEKQKLLAEQELAALRAKNAELNQDLDNQSATLSETNFADNTSQSNQVSNLAGRWDYTNAMGSYVFVFEQSGNQVTLQEYDSYGNNVGNGTGLIQGNDVLLNWVEPFLFVMSLEIEAELTVGSGGNILSGNMYADGNTMPITLYKQ